MGRRECACESANMEIGAEPHYPTPCMLLTANTGVPEFGISSTCAARRELSMPRAYTRKYQKELDDLLYFLWNIRNSDIF